MKIKQLLDMPIGTRINPGTLTIKTYKKTWQAEDVWWSQVILMDETGEMPADFNVGKTYNPLRGQCGGRVSIIVAEVQNAEYLGKDRKKLMVDQYSIPTQTVDEFQSKQDEIDKEVKLIIESKVRCWLVSASIQGQKLTKVEIIKWQEFVLTGE